MDIRIDSEEGKFKFRVCGIVKRNDKYLVVKINHNQFYCLPGGHVELDEDTDKAVLREMEEELACKFKINKLLAINQNFFKTNDGKPFHEIGYYYIVEALDDNYLCADDFVRDEMDKGVLQHLEFKWVSKEQLKNIPFRPTFISDILDSKEIILKITRC